MSARLVACASCGRLVFASEPRCPFCASTLARRVLTSVATVSAGLSLLGCPDNSNNNKATAEPDASASSSASASATASAETDASADASMDLLLGGGGVGMWDGGGLVGRGMSGVYGPAVTSSSGGGLANLGIRGECQLTGAKATVPIADVDRVIASLRARLRNAFNRGLQNDPTLAGKVEFTAKIATDGSVTEVTTKSTLPSSVQEELKTVVKRAQFSSPEKPSTLTWAMTCKKLD